MTGASVVRGERRDYSAFLAFVVFGAALVVVVFAAVAFGAAAFAVVVLAVVVVDFAAVVLVAAVALVAAFAAGLAAALAGAFAGALVVVVVGDGLGGRRGVRRVGAGRLRQRGASLAGGGLGALGLDGLAGGDAGLGGLDRCGLAGRLGDVAGLTTDAPPTAALTLRARRDLRRAAAFGWIAPALAARSRAEIASLRRVATSALVGSDGRGRQGLGDERLRGRPPGLEDRSPALGLADALQPGRGASSLPFPGRSGQGG